ncbi:hypothetical protein V6N13_049463 [Hibiscus sabdariffa]|uniref:At4g15545-like C-terminal domain-containing protein n=1 Tax=Hibiscus sabdariffa TaxID=183260 RepID=A0ABR2QXL9_9ROSI
MSEGTGGGRGGGGGGAMDFNLAEEVLAVIPTDPYEQLDLARKITSMAIASRVSKMEGDIGRMRATLFEKDRIIYELQEKLLRLHQENQDAESRLKIALDENINLSNERDSLAITAKKLSRDLSKPAETVDIGTCDQSVPKAYPDQDDGMNDYTSLRSSNGSMDMGSAIDEASGHGGQRFAITPYMSPQRTPETPKIISISDSPRGYSGAESPQIISGANPQTKPQYEGISPSWYSSSQQSSAASSPPCRHSLPGRSPRVDGKEFFRQARSQLSYEQFSAFLANIKELNAQKQTREETLRKAEEIFGTDNKDLFISFQGLLNRSVR